MITPYLSFVPSPPPHRKHQQHQGEARRVRTPGGREEEKQPLAVIPYASGVSEWIRKVCGKYNLKVVFKLGLTLHSLLTKVKDPFPKEKLAGVVYQIPCQW